MGSPALTITTDGRLALNADAGDLMKGLGAKFVHLLWDAEARKIALRPLTKADSRSYKLSVPHTRKHNVRGSFDLSALHRLAALGAVDLACRVEGKGKDFGGRIAYGERFYSWVTRNQNRNVAHS